MKTRISLILAVATITASALQALGQEEDVEQAEFPKITRQPVDDAIQIGSRHVLKVEAANADSFQWYRNGVALEGQTQSELVLENVGISDVGLYQCNVKKGDEAVPTRTSTLNVFSMSSGGGPIVVFGTPTAGSGGGGTSCPGSYVGYVNYVKPPPQWGWVPTSGTTVHTATDTNRTDTKVAYLGRYGDPGCAQTTVSVPHPPVSPKYRFTIYFPSNVPTNAYPIVLEGFDP